MKGGHLNEPDLLAKLEIATIIVCETEWFFFVVEDFQVMIIYLEGNIFRVGTEECLTSFFSIC